MLIVCSRRIASNGSRRARYVVVGSQLYNHGITKINDDDDDDDDIYDV